MHILDGIELESIESQKDLGLIINNKLDFGDQIKTCLLKATCRYSHDHSITSEVLSLVCPSLRVWKFKFMFVELMFFRFG